MTNPSRVQYTKPTAPAGSRLFAHRLRGKGQHLIEVHDDNGLAFIIKKLEQGSGWISWRCVERSPQWFIDNNSPGKWTLA